MKCVDCGHTLTEHRENHKFDVCGLPAVTLVDVLISRCGHCGEYLLSVPRHRDLHETLASAVIRKRARLTPAEVRYLRKWLGWSGRECADHLGTAVETVSRWENGKTPIGAQADRLLRLLTAWGTSVDSFNLAVLKHVAREPAADLPMRLRFDERQDAWSIEPEERENAGAPHAAAAGLS